MSCSKTEPPCFYLGNSGLCAFKNSGGEVACAPECSQSFVGDGHLEILTPCYLESDTGQEVSCEIALWSWAHACRVLASDEAN